MPPRNLLPAAACLLILAMAGGCATYRDADSQYDETGRTIRQGRQQFAEQSDQDKVTADPIRHTPTVDMAALPVASHPAHEILPAYRHIAINLPKPTTVAQLAEHIGRALGVDVSLEGIDALPPNLAKAAAERTMLLGSFDGGTERLLDNIAAQMDLVWSVSRNHLTLGFVDSKTYDFGLLNQAVRSETKLSTGGTGGGAADGGGTSSLTVSVKNTADPWAEIRDDLAALLPASSGATVSLLQSAGKVAVTARPSQLRRADGHIRTLLRDMTRTVSVVIGLYAVKRDDKDSYGLDLTTAFANNPVNRYFSLGYVSPTVAVASGAASLNAAAGGPAAPGNKFAGTDAVFQALTSIGRTAQIRRTEVLVQNNQIVSLHHLTEVAYVKSIGAGSTTSGAGLAVAFPTVTPGVTTYGFSVEVAPRIVDDTAVQLDYQIDMTSLDSLANFSAGNGFSVQQPVRTIIGIPTQMLKIGSGQTLVLAGMDISDATLAKIGLGDDAAPLLGGGRDGGTLSTSLVVTVTPVILKPGIDGPAESESLPPGETGPR